MEVAVKNRVFVFPIAVLLVPLFGNINVAFSQQPSTPGPALEKKPADGKDRDSKEIVALINGSRAVTQKEIDDAAGPQLYVLQEKVYTLRKKALDNLIIQVLLSDQAKKRGVTEAELRQQLTPHKVEVKQSDIDTAYANNLSILENMSEDEAKQRIRLDLETRMRLDAYRSAVSDIVSKGKIETFLTEPIPPSSRIRADGPSTGPVDAPVTVVEFSDFQCPYCRQAATNLRPLIKSYGANVRFVFKQMPLPIHAEAFKAAQASVCAGQQGKFWEYHDILFKSTELSEQALKRYASDVGLETNAFNTCLSSEASAKIVRKDMEEAMQAGVQGTPTYFVNGRIIKGIKSSDDFKSIIDQALRQKQRDSK
jgi:predicted DsbA family dithiol-disulfide isomerase